MPKASETQALKRVGECLYRNVQGTYFALVKRHGKQIKKSLETQDPEIARRKLTDLTRKVDRIQGQAQRDILFEELATQWLASVKFELKPSSYSPRDAAVFEVSAVKRRLSFCALS